MNRDRRPPQRGGGGRGRGDRQHQPYNPPTPQFPKYQFLVKEGEKEKIPQDLLEKTAEECSNVIIRTDGKENGSKNSNSQVRRFYGEVKSLEQRLQLGVEWDKIQPLVKIIKARVKYTAKRPQKVMGLGMETFLTEAISNVKTQKEFEVFCLFFEAVYGYLYGNGGFKKND
jgi:CRISPR type III-A-associated protein Csm2